MADNQITQEEQMRNDILREAVELVKADVTAYEDDVAFVTEDVAFHIRSLIRRLRKNYWGVFEEPNDPHTKRAKIWPPLTQITVDDSTKNDDLDQKDINVRAKNPHGYEFTALLRAKAIEEMDKMFFGEKLDELSQATNIDGTAVWKILDAPTNPQKRLIDIYYVDRLNFYISSTAHSIQEAYSVVERAVLTPAMVKANAKSWDNTDAVKYKKQIAQSDRQNSGVQAGGATAQYAEAFERQGTMPKYFITGNKKDKEMVEGRIIVSNPFDAPVVHLIEILKDGLKTYEERWCTRVPGRWDGRGTAEKIMMLQLWLGAVVNIRINRNTLAQLGILKVKKGSGITSQMLQRLASTGTITVNNIDDIEQMIVQEAGAGSYTDENNIKDWARRATSTYAGQTGEGLPASTPATNASIQQQAGDSHFVKSKEQYGLFLQRVFDRHALPRIIDDMSIGDVVRLSSDYDGFDGLVDTLAAYYVSTEYENLRAKNVVPTPQEVQQAIEAAKIKLTGRKDLFIEVLKEAGKDMCYTKVYVTNEEMDTNKLTDSLFTTLKVAPEYRDATIAALYDLLGLPRPTKTTPPANPNAPMPGAGQGGAQGAAAPQGMVPQNILPVNNVNVPA